MQANFSYSSTSKADTILNQHDGERGAVSKTAACVWPRNKKTGTPPPPRFDFAGASPHLISVSWLEFFKAAGLPSQCSVLEPEVCYCFIADNMKRPNPPPSDLPTSYVPPSSSLGQAMNGRSFRAARTTCLLLGALTILFFLAEMNESNTVTSTEPSKSSAASGGGGRGGSASGGGGDRGGGGTATTPSFPRGLRRFGSFEEYVVSGSFLRPWVSVVASSLPCEWSYSPVSITRTTAVLLGVLAHT